MPAEENGLSLSERAVLGHTVPTAETTFVGPPPDFPVLIRSGVTRLGIKGFIGFRVDRGYH